MGKNQNKLDDLHLSVKASKAARMKDNWYQVENSVLQASRQHSGAVVRKRLRPQESSDG